MPYCKKCNARIDDGITLCPYCGSNPWDEGSQDPLVGRTVAGKFQLLELLGIGGMGRVYKARHIILDRFVVLKILHEHYMEQPKLVKRFEREARAASRLDHPNSIQVIDFGQDKSGIIYMAMEYLEGRDLAQVLHEEGPLEESRIRNIGIQICAALEEAHNKQIVHRDLKPENIMILGSSNSREKVKVLDFGIAKILDLNETKTQALTQMGSVCGTPEYMSPEQARGDKLDGRSDIFALGVVLYQMATSTLPFPSDTPMAVVAKNLFEEPEPPSKRLKDRTISRGLEAIILKAMKKDPKNRFKNAGEMAVALEALGSGQAALDADQDSVGFRKIESENLTIVIVDLAGFTAKTSGQSRGENARFLKDFENIVIPLMQTFKGRKVKGLGDGYLLTFQSPTNAMLFAMALQDEAYRVSKNNQSEQIALRVAAHTGEVRLDKGDVLGQPVNLVSRIESVTPAGEIWFSESVYLSMTRSEIPCIEVGPRLLKGIAEPIKIYRIPGRGSEEPQGPPFRGIGTMRAKALGWKPDGHSLLAKSLMALRMRAFHVSMPWLVFSAIVVLSLAAGLFVLDFKKNDSDWLKPAEKALDSGKPAAALAILDNSKISLGPRGMLLKARALLAQGPRNIEEAEGLIQAALTLDSSLASSPDFTDSLISCLDRKNAQTTVALIEKHSSTVAVKKLKSVLASKSFWLRHNALQILEDLVQADRQDKVTVYSRDLELARSCRAKKKAVIALGRLKDPKALPLLIKTRKAGLFRNLCMIGTLNNAIRNLEKIDRKMLPRNGK
ncbi:MAG: protein kinase [Deltaproteobacteria bacterium]|nr:protein kinase [Deltaproteobacteria bacterium]